MNGDDDDSPPSEGLVSNSGSEVGYEDGDEGAVLGNADNYRSAA
jgi:hypothetical protein